MQPPSTNFPLSSYIIFICQNPNVLEHKSAPKLLIFARKWHTRLMQSLVDSKFVITQSQLSIQQCLEILLRFLVSLLSHCLRPLFCTFSFPPTLSYFLTPADDLSSLFINRIGLEILSSSYFHVENPTFSTDFLPSCVASFCCYLPSSSCGLDTISFLLLKGFILLITSSLQYQPFLFF